MTLDLTPNAHQRRSRRWPFAVQIVPVFGDAHSPAKHSYGPKFVVRGEVENALIVPPSVVDFGHGRWILGRNYAPEEIDVPALVELRDLTVQSLPAILTAVATPASGKYVIAITPSELLAAGEHAATLELLAVAADGTRLSANHIRLILQIGSDVTAQPKAMVVGAIRLGSAEKQVIDLSSSSGSYFEVLSIESPSEVIITRRGDGHRHYDLSINPARRGNGTLLVTFRIRQAHAEYDLSVPITYLAIE